MAPEGVKKAKKTNGSSTARKTNTKTSGKASGSQNHPSTGQRPKPQPQKGQYIYTMLWLIPLISIIILIWMFVLNLGYIDSEEMFGLTNETWFLISVLIVILLIIVMILSVTGSLLGEPVPASKPSASSGEQKGVVIEAVDESGKTVSAADSDNGASAIDAKEKGELVETKEAAGEEIPVGAVETAGDKVPLGAKVVGAPANIMVYPTGVGIGLYGDTYIKVDTEKLLKLRTLLIEDYYLA